MEAFTEEKPVNVGVVGTGLVGMNLANILLERDFPLADVRIFASERSAGETVQRFGRGVIVELAEAADYSGLDIVFNAAPAEFSKEHAVRIAEQGPTFIDSSSAWRQNPLVPLLIPEINPEVIDDIELGIVAKPNCTTTIGALALHYLHQHAGLKSIDASTYQSTSGQGQHGITEHRDQVRQLANRGDELLYGRMDRRLHPSYPLPKVFPTITAFNVAPMAGVFEDGSDHTTEELKFKNEMRKIFGRSPEELPIDVTCARASVVNGHSLSIHAEFEDEITTAEASEILARAEGVQLHTRDIPQPINAVGTDPVHVGRLRQSERFGKHGLNFWVVGDNLRKGAALNMVQGAELLIKNR